MRKDLNKQLCEEERHNSSDCYGNYRHLRQMNQKYEDLYDFDDEEDDYCAHHMSGGRESMKARFKLGWHEKEFGEHLSPLYGQIRKNVGRTWDDFYSELSTVFDTRSVINRHILLHLYDHIDVKGVFVGEDGELYRRNKYDQSVNPIGEDTSPYYVDPRDGIIKVNQKYKHYRTQRRERQLKHKAEQDKVLRVIDKYTELHNIDGVWFEIKYKYVEPEKERIDRPVRLARTASDLSHKHTYTFYRTVYPGTYDVLKKQTVYDSKVAVSKSTLSHKQLKKYGLI